MRDRRSNQIHPMDPKLFTKFYQIQNSLGIRNARDSDYLWYRSPATNAAMRRRSRGVATNSYHMRGQAIDFRIDGVPLAKIRQAAENLKSGGVAIIRKVILYM